ncbi:Zinc finger protein 99 [Holothuria leucospilota]|uniref:Zinc finger protein 99 n=1 Tax=Holothuria leucospilota TaxID=206669 RepID=A0A9Q1HGZ4_HOLLE|nr:Zinc finger protein 99 [Holothuria leucospilota]
MKVSSNRVMATTESVLDGLQEGEDGPMGGKTNKPSQETGIDDASLQGSTHLKDGEFLAQAPVNGSASRKQDTEMEEDHPMQTFTPKTVLPGTASFEDTGSFAFSESVTSYDTSLPKDSLQGVEDVAVERKGNSIHQVSNEQFQGTNELAVGIKVNHCNLPEKTVRKLDEENNTCTHKESRQYSVCTKPVCSIMNRYDRKLKVHKDENLFKCHFCEKTFTQKLNGERHEIMHTGERSFKCRYCEKWFTGKLNCIAHQVTHRTNKLFRCRICGKPFTQKADCTTHEVIHSGIQDINMENTADMKKDELLAEKRGTEIPVAVRGRDTDLQDKGCEPPPFPQEEDHQMQPSFSHHTFPAGTSSSRGDTGRIPWSSVNNDPCIQLNGTPQLAKDSKSEAQRGTVCILPGMHGTSQLALAIREYQRQSSHNFGRKLDVPKGIINSAKSFKCELCEKAFTSKNTLNEHQIVHTNEKSFKCQFCVKEFAWKRNLKRHEMTHTDEKPFKCLFCDKLFSRKQNCIIHEMTHTGEKPFKCQFCVKSFIQKADCRAHEMTHTGEKPFKCQFCGKSFTRKADCRTHEMTHTGEKPFKCQFCQKLFIRKQDCKKHEMTHARDKPFKCKFCKSSFGWKKNLKTHEKTHTREKSFRCQICEKAFNYKLSLKRHEKCHMDETPTKF